MYYLIVGVFLLAIIWLFVSVSPSRRLRKFGDRVPGPNSWPLLGNSSAFFDVESILTTIAAACNAYGRVVRVWIGKHLLFILSDPTDIEVFLSNSKFLEKSLPYRLFDSWLGTKGLLTSNGNTWQRHRKLVAPSFSLKILELSVDSMRGKASKLCDRLADRKDKQEFDIFQYVQRCAIDIICETAMGVEFGKLLLKSGHFYRTVYDSARKNYESHAADLLSRAEVDVKAEIETLNFNYYVDAINDLRTIGMKRFFRPWIHPEWLFKWTYSGQVYYNSLRAAQDCITAIIQDRKHYLEEKLSKSDTEEETKKDTVKIFLDLLLEDSNFTNDEIENEVQTFMFGGSVTLPTTIAFCLYLLSKHPDVQEKIVQETEMLKSQTETDELNYQDYMKMKYLENVIKETLRIYTTVPLIARTITQDVQLPSGHILPAGSVAGICLLHMHNNEKYFLNADQFIPERFEEKNHNRHIYSYIPFSAGPRNCIGKGVIGKVLSGLKSKEGNSSTKVTDNGESSHRREEEFEYTPYKGDYWQQMKTHYPQLTGPGSIYYEEPSAPVEDNPMNVVRVIPSDYVDNPIGQKYAMLEMKIVISTLLVKYRILPSQDVQELTIETGFALMSLNKHPVRITSRT